MGETSNAQAVTETSTSRAVAEMEAKLVAATEMKTSLKVQLDALQKDYDETMTEKQQLAKELADLKCTLEKVTNEAKLEQERAHNALKSELCAAKDLLAEVL